MVVQVELEQDGEMDEGLEHDPVDSFAPVSSAPSPQAQSTVASNREAEASSESRSARGQTLEEASFLVIESGKIRFFVRPRVEVEAPTSLEDVQRFSFTLAPRNRGSVRRISVGKKRMPDPRVRERQWAYVDRVGSAAHVVSDLGPRRYTTKTRGVRNQPGVIEVARGTYAIATHRDHAHLLYELELENDAIAGMLIRQLRLVPRASYIAAVFNPQAKWRVRDREEPETPFSEPSILDDGLMDKFGKRRFTPLDPVFLEHEGTELVLIGGGQAAEDDEAVSWRRA